MTAVTELAGVDGQAGPSRAQLSRAELAVLDAIDEQGVVDELVRSIRVPSTTGSDAESEAQHQQAAQLAQLGFDVDTWSLDLPALAAHPAFPGTEAPRTEGWGVVGVLGPAGVPALVLQGHVDVVPTGDLDKWVDRAPFSGAVRGGAVHGRGACDMKAGCAANLGVARALAASGVRLERPFAVHSVVGEEDGGLGAFATMLRGHRGDAAVITEPTSGRVLVANAGALTFQLTVDGRAAHGSTRMAGHSAIEAFLPVLAALTELERERNADPHALFVDHELPYPISVGTLRAGDWASSVPDVLVAEGRMGVQLGEAPEDARDALRRALDEAAVADPWLRDHPVRLAWTGGQFASGQLVAGHPLIGEVGRAVQDVEGREATTAAAPYGSDLRLYTGLGGIPTLQYGPGDVRFAHAPREQVGIEELLRTTRTLAVLAARRCGAHL
ncbi:acetylornithine deacetylase [Klenkia marina]|uniref:Acetylornithine deacetylase n=1 Tax=Klenkia marina TaxID=1960309 RepID=A0A1G4YM55_9ACTN|nr:ArgE/DapE family deacylase [Klenkia marina]SCX54399.1 acetylornithine deacetylase [Klenkia marina]